MDERKIFSDHTHKKKKKPHSSSHAIVSLTSGVKHKR